MATLWEMAQQIVTAHATNLGANFEKARAARQVNLGKDKGKKK